MFADKIEERQKIRTDIAANRRLACAAHLTRAESTFLLISESLDDYIAQREKSDKVLEGILKDMQSNMAAMAEK